MCLFVVNRGKSYYSIVAGSRWGSQAKPILLIILTLGRHYHLTSLKLWSTYFYLETYNCARSPELLAKSALSCWMYTTAQITSSLTPSHLWVSLEWPYCQRAQWGPWFTVKQASRPQVILKTQPHICLDYRPATDPSLWMKWTVSVTNIQE